MQDFARLVQKAREKSSRDQEKMAAQKFRSIQNAFSEVHPEDIRKFVKLFYLDFEMFGYEKLPDFVVDADS